MNSGVVQRASRDRDAQVKTGGGATLGRTPPRTTELEVLHLLIVVMAPGIIKKQVCGRIGLERTALRTTGVRLAVATTGALTAILGLAQDNERPPRAQRRDAAQGASHIAAQYSIKLHL